MPDTDRAAAILSVVEETARSLGVACSLDKVSPVLTAYRDVLAESMVVLGIDADEPRSGEIEITFSVPPSDADPYDLAVSNGFIAETGHPAATLLSEIRDRCDITAYGVDCGVVRGFRKSYVGFPLDNWQTLATLSGLPSIPSGVAANAECLARYGLDENVSMLAIDYQSRTINVYFGGLPEGILEPETVSSMLRELGLPEPSEQMMEFVQKSFSIYPTFSWDTPEVQRICFSAVTPEPIPLPTPAGPVISRFLKDAPYSYSGKRIIVYGGVLSSSGENYKLGWYFQEPHPTWRKLEVFDAIEGSA
ncbi:aromatic prenyltransferase [Nocardia lijiangensis]|uniref:aromatic prenyltransferase n=1 Tax=Nocardia lijiangensis TaxID=299618 RepID=UPI003D709BE4